MRLAALARQLSADPEFVAAIESEAASYRFSRALDRRSTTATRAALSRFGRQARGLADWLGAALGGAETPQRDAVRKLNAAGLERGWLTRDRLEQMQATLLELALLETRASEFLRDGSRQKAAAPRLAAAALWALLPRHGVKVSMYENSDAVRLLVAIARDAGDRSLTPLAAKKFLQETQPEKRRSKKTAAPTRAKRSASSRRIRS